LSSVNDNVSKVNKPFKRIILSQSSIFFRFFKIIYFLNCQTNCEFVRIQDMI